MKTMWPPNGGDPVIVLASNVETMRARGWLDEKPEAKPEPKEKEKGK